MVLLKKQMPPYRLSSHKPACPHALGSGDQWQVKRALASWDIAILGWSLNRSCLPQKAAQHPVVTKTDAIMTLHQGTQKLKKPIPQLLAAGQQQLTWRQVHSTSWMCWDRDLQALTQSRKVVHPRLNKRPTCHVATNSSL